MALKIWLPLDGSLRNLGTDNPQITNNGATIDNNGKIGKCYSFGNNKYFKIENYATEFLTYNEFSLSVWFKCTAQNTAHGGSALISCGNWNQPANLLNLALGYFSSDHYTRLLVSGSGVWSEGYSYNFYLNQWYNVVLTSGNGAVRAYVNGELIGDSYAAFKPASLEQTWICIGNGTYVQVFPFYGLMNDVRIYNNCLSALEVKELSQGLVLHYKLDGLLGGVGENLLPCGGLYTKKNPWTTTLNRKDGYAWVPNSAFEGKPSTTYTISVECDGTLNDRHGSLGNLTIVDKPWTFWLYVSNVDTTKSWSTGSYDSAINLTSANHNYQKIGNTHVWTYTLSSSQKYISLRTNSYSDGTNNVTINWWNMKIEEGDTFTSYIQPLSDLNLDTTKIYDSSGYGNDGILTGILETSNDTSKYQLSSFFNGIDTAIQIPYNATVWQDNFTINLWFKKNELGSKNYETLIGGPSGFEMDTRAGSATTLSFYMASVRGGNVYSPFNFGEWYMVTLVNNGINELYYVNGNLVKTIEKKSMPTGNYFIGAWQTKAKQNYKGEMSDFRIYATALDEKAIKKLYNTPTEIDKNHNYHTMEIVENNGGGRELMAGLVWTSPYNRHDPTTYPHTIFNSKKEHYLEGSNISIGSEYVKINPVGKTYYYDMEISVSAGNQVYIGFERYDKDKTSRANNACIYAKSIKPTTDLIHKRYFGTINLATDGTNQTDTIALRILNGWGGTTENSTKIMTIHYLSLREIDGNITQPRIEKNGITFGDEFIEKDSDNTFFKNGFIGGSVLIEK